MVSKDTLKVLSQIIGWTYTLLWSFANFPQFLHNAKRKSVAGYSVTFQVLNSLGFTCYSLYVFFGFFYQRAHDGMTHSIIVQDLLFAGICTVIVYALSVQCVIYRKTITDPIHPVYRFIMIVITTLCLYNVCLSASGRLEWFSKSSSATAFSTLQFFGYCKSFISFIKYVPQVYLNITTRSTRGISMINVWMDISGGVCSFLQSYIDAHVDSKPDGSPDFSNITSNIPKLILALESMAFCLIFMSQHYVLFRSNNARLEREELAMREGGIIIDDTTSLLDEPNDSVNNYSSVYDQ